jgi:hypothetical protein
LVLALLSKGYKIQFGSIGDSWVTPKKMGLERKQGNGI